MSYKMKHGHWVTTDEKKEDFEENIRKAVEGLKKELGDRKACFVAAHNEIFEEEGLTAKDIDENDYEDLMDICELYHRLRAGKTIMK